MSAWARIDVMFDSNFHTQEGKDQNAKPPAWRPLVGKDHEVHAFAFPAHERIESIAFGDDLMEGSLDE